LTVAAARARAGLADRRRCGGARQRLASAADRPDGEPEPRAGRRDDAGDGRRGRARHLDADQRVVVDRRCARQVPVRLRVGPADRGRRTHDRGSQPELQGALGDLLAQPRDGRRPHDDAGAGHAFLRQGRTGADRPGRPCVAGVPVPLDRRVRRRLVTDVRPAAPLQRDPGFAARFDAMAAYVSSSARSGEVLFASLRGERADYLRVNHGRVRQAGTVERAVVSLRLVDAQRQASSVRTLGEDAAIGAVLAEAHAELRAALAGLPADPFACWQPKATCSEQVRGGPVADPASIIDAIVAAADGDDLVGLYAGGPVVRGLASSLGHRHYHETVSSSFDFSLHLDGGRAVKETWTAEHWDAQSLHTAIAA